MEKYITVAEAAEIFNVSKQSVYNMLQKDLKPYTKILNGKKVILSRAIKDMAADQPDDMQDEIEKLKQKTIEALEKHIETLEKQLEQKDRQINDLNDRLSEVNKIAFRQIAPKEATFLIEAAEDKKDTFIKRIFRKRGTKE